MVDDATFGSGTGIHACTIEQAGSGHFVEITSTGTISLDNLQFSGFGADGTTSAAIYNNSGGAVTINILNGGATPTVRNGTGASTTIQNTVTIEATVTDPDGNAITTQDARVLIEASTGQ